MISPISKYIAADSVITAKQYGTLLTVIARMEKELGAMRRASTDEKLWVMEELAHLRNLRDYNKPAHAP